MHSGNIATTKPKNARKARELIMNSVSGFVCYTKSCHDFAAWMEAIYAKEKSIEHIQILYPEFASRFPREFYAKLLKNHLAIVNAQSMPNEYFENAALTITLMAGPTPEYLLHVVKKMHDRMRFPSPMPKSLLTAIQKAITLEHLDEHSQIALGTDEKRSANLIALIKAYPIEFCHSTLDITCIAASITSCQEMFIAANITITFDKTTMQNHITCIEKQRSTRRGHLYPEEAYVRIIQSEELGQPTLSPIAQAVELQFKSIAAQPAQLQEACAAKELYINSYISYFLRCHHIMSRWTPIASTPLQRTNNGERPKIPSECIMHILYFIDSMPTPCTKIANGAIHQSAQLRIGGELHNLMVTSTISKWYASSELKPSIENSARWECIKFALNEKIIAKNNNANVSRGTDQ